MIIPDIILCVVGNNHFVSCSYRPFLIEGPVSHCFRERSKEIEREGGNRGERVEERAGDRERGGGYTFESRESGRRG